MKQLIGLTPAAIEATEDEIKMAFTNGALARWYHSQYCCESVTIEDVNGEWTDLIGHPLLVAEERTVQKGEEGVPPTREEKDGPTEWSSDDESYTWTFYAFRCIGGSVDVRWYGSSNGYYSEGVDFEFTDAPAQEPAAPVTSATSFPAFDQFKAEADAAFATARDA